ncbi:MAG: C13 family peptidase [Gammaproteobacteria bacterium]
MDPLVVDVELAPTDWDALQRYLQTRSKQRTSRRDYLLNALLAAVPVIIVLYLLESGHGQLSPLTIAVGLLAVGFCVTLLRRRALRAARPKPGSASIAGTRFEIDSIGLRTVRKHQSGFADWHVVQAIDETSEHVFLPLDTLVAYVIPKRQIVSVAPEAFVAQLRQWHAERRERSTSSSKAASLDAGHGSLTTPESSEAPPWSTAPESLDAPHAPSTASASLGALRTRSSSPAPRRTFWSDLRANLLVGMRVFFFRPVRPTDIVSSFDQVVALLLILLGVAAALDRATAGVDAEFMTFGLYTWFALILLGLWVSALIARSMSERADTRTLLVVGLATAPWVLIVSTALSFIPASDGSGWFTYAVMAIALWAGFRAVRATYGYVQRQATMVMAISLVAIALAQNYLYFETHLWAEVSDEDESDLRTPSSQEAEAIFFDQSGFVSEALDRLEPQRPGVTDLYYVGFAGDGYQRVFRREALFSQRVFADRLGTGPRSLELINDYEDRESFPLATLVALRYALSGIGKEMDPKEDVLVLFLTSHGSREGGISVRNGVSTIDSDLPPDDVRSALDDAGIRWRIVIVSACYSGVFVEPLKSDTTMILTAADSQNTSFGCADDRELTYFGEAFLRDSLPKAPSLPAAFEHAREEIAVREKQEKLTPSNPQMWVGASMAKKLGQLGSLPLGIGH